MTAVSDERDAVRALLDREALRDLVARYAFCVDDHDLDAVAVMFHPEAVFDRDGAPTVFLRQDGRFVPPKVKVVARTQTRVVIDGLQFRADSAELQAYLATRTPNGGN